MCACLCVSARFIPFCTSFKFHFHHKKFLLSSLPSVSSPARPVCCLSRGVGDRQMEKGREGEIEREREDARKKNADYSWLAALCVLWIAYECKGNTAFWQFCRTNSNAWNDGWVDRYMLLVFFAGCPLFLAHVHFVLREFLRHATKNICLHLHLYWNWYASLDQFWIQISSQNTEVGKLIINNDWNLEK